MIRTDRGLSATRESLMSLEEALLDLTRHRVEYHPRTFELLAAPIREEILARRAEIDAYIGMTAGRPDQSPGDARTPPNARECEYAYVVSRSAGVEVPAQRIKRLVPASENKRSDVAAIAS